MTKLRLIKPAMWFSGVVLAGAVTAANAQAPEPKGPSAKVLLNLDLASEIAAVEGRVLRMQVTTYEPGASNKLHSHKDRPEVVYILSGKVIEHRGGLAREYGLGDSFAADHDTMHWMENTGTVPAVMVVTGIAKKE